VKGDAGGKVNILGGDNEKKKKKKNSYGHVSHSGWLPR
jgi:hypothetical protein